MKGVVEGCLSIDLRRFSREGHLTHGNIFNCRMTRGNETLDQVLVLVQAGSLNLFYRNKSQIIMFATTECHLGGSRRWLRCGCGKRAAILYAGGSQFACRHCLQLNYKTQHLEPHERLAIKAHKLRDQLGWPRGFLSGHETKPKGMHWATFEGLAVKAEDAIERFNIAARAKFPDYEGFG